MMVKKPPGAYFIVLLLAATVTGVSCAPKLKNLPSVSLGREATSLLINSVTLKSGSLPAYAAVLDILPSRSIDIEPSMPPALNSTGIYSWNILNKLAEKDDELSKVSVSIGPREMVYHENRISVLSYSTQGECLKRRGVWDENYALCKSITRKKLSDKERAIGLKLLNTATGDVETVKVQTKVTKDGVSIVSPSGYEIEIVERPNGIKWNYWNTMYKVTAPANTVVIKNVFPREETVASSRVVKGKVIKSTKKVARGFLYVPYNEYLDQDIIVAEGRNYIKSVVAQAFANLREKGVKSKFFDRPVADIEALSPRFFERLPLLEQSDLTEFKINQTKTARRALVLIGANKEIAFAPTCNRASACGLIQFTPKTYSSIRRTNPSAKLTADFKTGAANHVNVMMAAILLHQTNLAELVKRYGEGIMSDPQLEEYLAAAYNGAPRWVHQSLNATLGKVVSDWTKHLRNETHGFIYKLRYLVANDLP